MPVRKLFIVALACVLTLFRASAEISTNSTPSTNPTATTTNPAVADLNELITRINGKLQQDKNTEADLADNIKEFDALLTKHKDAKAEDRANILLQKGMLYAQVLNEPDKALEVFKQFKSDFPTLQINGNTDEFLASLQQSAEKKKIRDSLSPGTPFPDFEVKDLNGKPLSVAQYKGKVVLVNFWGTWCPPCIVEMPDLLKVYKQYHSKGFEVIGIDMDEEKGRLESFIKSRDIPWPQNFEGKRWDNTLAAKYGVDSTPTSYLIDREGKIVTRYTIPKDLIDNLDAAVAKAVNNPTAGK